MPASGVGSLPKNIFVLKLIQKTETANNGYSQPLCDECSSNSEDDHDSVGINFAVEYCTDCKLKLCKGCKHIHRRSQVNRSHTFVKLVTNGEHSSEDIALALQDGCSNHGGDKLKLYCHACKTVICMTCFDEDHVTHPCSEVRAVEKELRRQMTNDINSLSVELETCRQLIAQVERNKKTLTDKVFDVQNEVRQEAERLKSAIEQDKETLLRQISSGCRRLEEISDELGRLKEHISVAEWSRSYADVLINYGAGVDIARHWQAMKMALDELSKFSISTSYSDFDSMKVTYTPSKVINRDSIKNVVGEINGKMTVKRKHAVYLFRWEGKNGIKMHYVPFYVPVVSTKRICQFCQFFVNFSLQSLASSSYLCYCKYCVDNCIW